METSLIIALITIVCLIAVCILLYILMSKLGQRAGRLEEKLKNKASRISALEEEARSRSSRISSLEDHVQKKSSEIASLRTNLATYKNAEEVVKNLNFRVEEAKQDLEEAQRSIERIQARLKEKTDENSSLQDNLHNTLKTVKELEESLKTQEAEAEEANRKYSEASEALDFIQEILTAPVADNSSLTEKWSRIRDISAFISSDLQKFVKDNFKEDEWSGFIFGQGLSQWEATARKDWIAGKKTVAFIGEFSAGKTSIVNRILSQDNPNAPLLPVSSKATTAVPTYITGGESATYQFVSPDGTLKEIKEETFKKVSKEILENINGTSQLISYFVMTYRNPLLSGMSILDTPGFNSEDKMDSVRTIEVINECDALFWVFDVNTGTINQSSLDIIKKNMSRPLYVIINKVDTKSEEDTAKVEELIRTAFVEEGIKIEGCLRFSSHTPLDELMATIAEIKKDKAPEKYISTLLKTYIPSLVQICQENVKAASSTLDTSYRKCDEKTALISSLCSTIQRDSITAANIPHWETHFIGKDRYEMDKAEGKKLVDILDKVAYTDVVSLSDQVNEYGTLMQENQKAYAEKNRHLYVLGQINTLYGKLNGLIKNLNS